MPPMCTPDKIRGDETNNSIDELYYNPNGEEEYITDISEDDEAERLADEKMDKLLLDFPELEEYFNLHGQAGEGAFSTVYVASLKNANDHKKYAIKHVVPTCHPDRIKFELQCLKQIGGSNNVAGVELCLRNLNNVIFIMPFQRHDCFNEYVGEMDELETKVYMKNLLIALRHVHKFKIIHRDIKPSNFLYDRSSKRFLLVDFGLAQKQQEKSTETGTESAKDTSNGSKRKRDPLSPLNGIVQDPKRFVLTKSSVKSPTIITKLIGTPNQKENTTNLRNINGKATPGNVEKETAKITTLVNYEHKSPDLPDKKDQGQPQCRCYGKPQICSMCPLNNPIQASRAGTPGFRPPEVLFKYPHQTIAVDVWAAGIIMLSILSSCSNFSSCPNDVAALLELVTLFGHDKIKRIGNKFGRYFICSEKRPGLDLRKVCCTLRNRGGKLTTMLKGEKCNTCLQYTRVCLCPHVPLDKNLKDEFPDSAYDLLTRMLDLNPKTRITAEEALEHPFFDDVRTSDTSVSQ